MEEGCGIKMNKYFFIFVLFVFLAMGSYAAEKKQEKLVIHIKEYQWAPHLEENIINVVEKKNENNQFMYGVVFLKGKKQIKSSLLTPDAFRIIQTQLLSFTYSQKFRDSRKPASCKPMMDLDLKRMKNKARICQGNFGEYFQVWSILNQL